jgi:DNA helicase-2/ATP-dependent DNA helicase PcrA
MVERIFEDHENPLSLTQLRNEHHRYPFLNQLNPNQLEAVTSQARNLLVLAGAGSGKTTVLICRIAWLIYVKGLEQEQIMVVTFTNKAASEIRQRLSRILDLSGNKFWVGTFHGIALRLLRIHSEEAGLPEDFRIIDDKEQKSLIKKIIEDLNLNTKLCKAGDIQTYINNKKDERKRAVSLHNVVNDERSADEYTKSSIYERYEMRCNQEGLVDFAELLLRSYELLRNNSELLQYYRMRFKHVLVDEFQDTNRVQHEWLRMLNGDDNHITVVGDEDQSIYGWRGAQINNILNFKQNFGRAYEIRLEQNYRSTGTILNAANCVISNNRNRIGKRLWTAGEDGEYITKYEAPTDTMEARYVVDRIKEYHREGISMKDVAVLYRTKAQYHVLERALIQGHIPYRIYGGLRFFDRAEIKVVLAYLRLIVSSHDNIAFERVYNVPKRKIGKTTFKKIRDLAWSEEQSYWEASNSLIQNRSLTGLARTTLKGFLELIKALQQNLHSCPISEMIEEVIKATQLEAYYEKEKDGKGKVRIENLSELVKIAHDFTREKDGNNILASFLDSAALDLGDRDGYNGDAVQLMTLHMAKGLEFPIVFLVGLEENLFPAYQSIDDPVSLEEERRLCYVGITRAMKKLYISYAEHRLLNGQKKQQEASRFLREVPRSLIGR